MDKEINLYSDSHKGIINIINAENNDIFKNQFNIEIIDEQSEEIQINEKNEQKFEEIKIKEKSEKEKDIIKTTLNEDKEMNLKEKKEDKNKKKKINYKVDTFINFREAKEFSFSKYIIKNEEKIKNAIKKDLKKPSENDVKNPPEILIDNCNINQFIESNKHLRELSLSLFETFITINNNKINEEKIIKKFESEIKQLINCLDCSKRQLKLNVNEFEYLSISSADLENEITDFLLHLKNYYKNYNKSVKSLLTEFFKLKEKDIFSLDFSLPYMPENLDKSGIVLKK